MSFTRFMLEESVMAKKGKKSRKKEAREIRDRDVIGELFPPEVTTRFDTALSSQASEGLRLEKNCSGVTKEQARFR